MDQNPPDSSALHVENLAEPTSSTAGVDPDILQRLVEYSDQIALLTAYQMAESCRGSMHLPVWPNDPDSMPASRLIDSVILGDAEIVYAHPNASRQRSEQQNPEPGGPQQLSTGGVMGAASRASSPIDPGSTPENEPRDSISVDGEIPDKLASPCPSELEGVGVQFRRSVTALRVNIDRFLRLTDDKLPPTGETTVATEPDIWVQDGFTFLRLN